MKEPRGLNRVPAMMRTAAGSSTHANVWAAVCLSQSLHTFSPQICFYRSQPLQHRGVNLTFKGKGVNVPTIEKAHQKDLCREMETKNVTNTCNRSSEIQKLKFLVTHPLAQGFVHSQGWKY